MAERQMHRIANPIKVGLTPTLTSKHAPMVELVDTLVLEASTSVCEFESRLGHHSIIYFLSNNATALAKVTTTVKYLMHRIHKIHTRWLQELTDRFLEVYYTMVKIFAPMVK